MTNIESLIARYTEGAAEAMVTAIEAGTNNPSSDWVHLIDRPAPKVDTETDMDRLCKGFIALKRRAS